VTSRIRGKLTVRGNGSVTIRDVDVDGDITVVAEPRRPLSGEEGHFDGAQKSCYAGYGCTDDCPVSLVSQNAKPFVSVLKPGPTGVQKIHDLVREDRITAEQGAWLLQLREELRLARRPWWQKALSFIWRVLCA